MRSDIIQHNLPLASSWITFFYSFSFSFTLPLSLYLSLPSLSDSNLCLWRGDGQIILLRLAVMCEYRPSFSQAKLVLYSSSRQALFQTHVTQAHTLTQTHAHTHTHTVIDTYTDTHTHTHTYAYIHTLKHIQTYTHTHTHTHRVWYTLCSACSGGFILHLERGRICFGTRLWWLSWVDYCG